jgi:hypothetical protein
MEGEKGDALGVWELEVPPAVLIFLASRLASLLASSLISLITFISALSTPRATMLASICFCSAIECQPTSMDHTGSTTDLPAVV